MKLLKNKRFASVAIAILALVLVITTLSVGVFADSGEAAAEGSKFHATIWALLPPVIAIGLALITKEV